MATDEVRLLNGNILNGTPWLTIGVEGTQTRTLRQSEYPHACSAVIEKFAHIAKEVIARMLVTPDMPPVARVHGAHRAPLRARSY